MQEIRETDVEARRQQQGTSEDPDLVYEGSHVCARCGKKLIVRASTPGKSFGDGKLRRFCKRCWFRKMKMDR